LKVKYSAPFTFMGHFDDGEGANQIQRSIGESGAACADFGDEGADGRRFESPFSVHKTACHKK
jgi:hypothetical protein